MNVYEQVTDRIISLLEEGTIPWRKPWHTGAPRSLATDQTYRGINALILGTAPYGSPYWVTYDQAKARGGFVRRGEKGWPLIFWKVVENKDQATGETVDSYPVLRQWTVFNVEQCDGLAYPRPEPRDLNDIDAAQRLIDHMPNPPSVFHDSSSAYYLPRTDTVHLPLKTAFHSSAGYYSTAFHELIHATGHPTRLDRPDVMKPEFGSDLYAREELVAEMGAAMLCGLAGIAPQTLDNSAAYLASWLRALREDSRLVVQSAAAAQKAADYIAKPNEVMAKPSEAIAQPVE
jgi:antirestriction protein ArdC